MEVREGGEIGLGDFGETRVIRRREITAERILAADQVLVGRNKTRRLYNGRIRELRGYGSPTPEVGEKLVCLRNDKTKGIQNGGLFRVSRVKDPKGGLLRLELAPEDANERRRVSAAILPAFFEGGEEALPFALRRKSDEFDWGYALTVHKAQGSQWDDVVLFDESFAFREHRARWLYTGITRAAERLTVVV
jgi:exodeoxyribonuclease-5